MSGTELNWYQGRDTWQSIETSADSLEQVVSQIRSEHQGNPAIVLVGHSLGGAVAARWASRENEHDVLIVTLDSPLSGSWPEDVGDRYCQPGPVARPFPLSSLGAFLGACTVGISKPAFVDAAAANLRAQLRAGVVQPGIRLFAGANRRDMPVPVWWAASPTAEGRAIIDCDSPWDANHGCVLQILARRVANALLGVDAAGTAGTSIDFNALATAFGTDSVPGAYALRITANRNDSIVGLRENDACLPDVSYQGSEAVVQFPLWVPHGVDIIIQNRSGKRFLIPAKMLPAAGVTEYTIDNLTAPQPTSAPGC